MRARRRHPGSRESPGWQSAPCRSVPIPGRHDKVPPAVLARRRLSSPSGWSSRSACSSSPSAAGWAVPGRRSRARSRGGATGRRRHVRGHLSSASASPCPLASAHRQPRQRQQPGRRDQADRRGEGGRELFGEHCGVCHTLAAANAIGKVGPNLDTLQPPASLVLNTIDNGCLPNAPSGSAEHCLGQGVDARRRRPGQQTPRTSRTSWPRWPGRSSVPGEVAARIASVAAGRMPPRTR